MARYAAPMSRMRIGRVRMSNWKSNAPSGRKGITRSPTRRAAGKLIPTRASKTLIADRQAQPGEELLLPPVEEQGQRNAQGDRQDDVPAPVHLSPQRLAA